MTMMNASEQARAAIVGTLLLIGVSLGIALGTFLAERRAALACATLRSEIEAQNVAMRFCNERVDAIFGKGRK